MTTRDDLRRRTQDKVLRAAEELFAARGFKGTTIRDIAERTGLSVGAVMSVGDKRALLAASFDRRIAAIHADRRAHPTATDDTQDHVARIIDLVLPFVEVFTEHPDLSREYGAVLMGGTHQSAVFENLVDHLLLELETAVVAAGVAGSEAAVCARTIYLSYLGLIFMWAGRGAVDDDSFATHLHAVVSFAIQSKEK
ncbi:TetR/AcrR family transcriptional regulator [Cellulomonas sp. URHB0016]